LTSNLRLEAVRTLKNHPFLSYLRLGLPVSLSTDDEGIVDTDINQECREAIETSDITYIEMKKMAFNSIESSFLSLPEKSALLALLATQFREFENSLNSLF
jgi:adenosine deaminase CECR1